VIKRFSRRRILDPRPAVRVAETDERARRYYRRIHRITGKVPWSYWDTICPDDRKWWAANGKKKDFRKIYRAGVRR
jgi:hypothetical protein